MLLAICYSECYNNAKESEAIFVWKHQTDDKRGWKYTVTANKYTIQISGGSIAILDSQTQTLLKQHKGHHYLYTGDIRPDETQCFALENGKHFYVYSLENYELIKRITLPRGYVSIDMYGHYSEDGTKICIPAHKWIGNEATGEGYYEYVICRYDARQLSLIEKVIIEDPNRYLWEIDQPQPALDEAETETFQKIIDIVSANLENKDFMDRLSGLKPEEDDSAVREIMKLIFDTQNE